MHLEGLATVLEGLLIVVLFVSVVGALAYLGLYAAFEVARQIERRRL